MIDWVNSKVLELIGLARAAAVLVAVVMVVIAYAKSRSMVTLIAAALTAGVFLWAVNNTDWWQQKVGEETGAATTMAVELDPLPAAPISVSALEATGPER